jgi:hypothetical protein
MASYDLDSRTVAQRLLEWSQYTGPAQAPAQVAALLGVRPGDDAGQPERLALHVTPSAPVQLAEASAPPPPVKMADAPAIETAAVEATAVETVAAEAQTLFAAAPDQKVVFAPRSEIVQAVAKPSPAVAKAEARFQRAAFVQPDGGRYVVQIGAYDSVGVAEDAWGRAVKRVAAFREFTPSTAVFVKDSRTFYRLSVSGFGTRASAVSFCETFRTRGGSCFVREQAGDAPLQWAGRASGPKFAAR